MTLRHEGELSSPVDGSTVTGSDPAGPVSGVSVPVSAPLVTTVSGEPVPVSVPLVAVSDP